MGKQGRAEGWEMSSDGVIKTERLLIVPFSERHLTGRYVGWLNDPELMRYSEQRHKTHSMETCRSYMESFQGTPNRFWAVEAAAGGLGHIGNINAYVDVFNRVADIGILIGEKDAGNRGFGSEVFSAVCRYLFEREQMRKVTAGTVSVNTPMLRLMHRAGMTEDGIRRRHYIVDGNAVDIVHMALFKENTD